MRNEEHRCGIEKCRNCRQEVEIKTYKCYMQWKKQKGGKCKREVCLCKGNPEQFVKPIKDFDQEKKLPKCTYTENYIFFDYEAQQETSIHIPSLVIAHDFNGNEYKFKTNYEFCKWLISNEHKDYTLYSTLCKKL